MLRRNNADKSEFELAPRHCLICGSPTRYAHMEIDACRACAVFYRRLTVRKKPLVCRTGQLDCDTMKSGNFCCKRCRFDRFTAVLNESRKPRNRHESHCSVDEPSTSSSTPTQIAPEPVRLRLMRGMENSVLASVRRGHTLMNAIRRASELSTRTHIPDEQGICVDGMVIIPTTYTLLNQTTRILISSIFEFASNAFDEFKTLKYEEQWLLVRNFYPFISVLDSEYRMTKLLPEHDTMVFSSYATYLDHCTVSTFLSDSPTTTKNRDDAKRFVSCHLNGDVRQMRARMKRWSPTEDEYLAFIGICFWSLGGNFCCKRCRFDRFTAVLNESRKPRNRHESHCSVDGPSTSSSTPTQIAPEPVRLRLMRGMENSVLASVRRGHTLMNAIRRASELSTRTHVPDEQGICVDGMVIIPTTYTLLNQTTRILISSIFEFASNAFEEFKTLKYEEQWLLVRNFYPFISVLDSEYRMTKLLPEHDTMVFSSYATYLDHCTVSTFLSDSPATTKNRDDAKRFVSCHLNGDVRQMRQRMKRWSPTEDEYLAFIGICFWSLDKISVSDKVHAIADNYRQLLFLELDGLYRQTMGLDEYAARMGEAVLFIETIQSAFFEMRSKMGMLKLLDIIGDELLMAQMHL